MRSGNVLLVEDDPAVAQFLMTMLKMWGYNARYASTSREAVDFAVLHQNDLGLVVCDINLQGESGLAVAAKIRSICPRIKMLFTSGSPIDDLCESGLLTRETLQDGDTCYIQKPFLCKDLSNAIHSLFQPAQEGARSESKTGIQYARAAY